MIRTSPFLQEQAEFLFFIPPDHGRIEIQTPIRGAADCDHQIEIGRHRLAIEHLSADQRRISPMYCVEDRLIGGGCCRSQMRRCSHKECDQPDPPHSSIGAPNNRSRVKSLMRVLLVLVMVIIPAAQTPIVHIVNTSHPSANTFQIGDRFEILITGAPKQPVSVRTTMNGRTDWSPVIGSTDSTGRWSTAGQFEKSDFGSWHEIWTVGGRLANPAVEFSVSAPCLPGGWGMAASTGGHSALTCDTAEGRQTFLTPSTPDFFQTPDGRLVPGSSIGHETQDEYQMGILQEIITGQPYTGTLGLQSSRGGRGDETAGMSNTGHVKHRACQTPGMSNTGCFSSRAGI